MTRTSLFPLRRARLELDRALRGRSFVHRAVIGFIEADEYHDLIASASALVLRSGPSGPGLAAVEAAAQADLLMLRPGRPAKQRSDEVVELYARAIGRKNARRELAQLVLGALLGLSWVEQAEASLSKHHSTTFLSELSEWGQACYRRLQQESWSTAELHALTEITRGAVLGCFTHLEARWPVPLSLPLTPGVSS